MTRVRNFGWWCHQQVAAVADAWTVKGPKPKIHDKAVAQVRKDWPRLADALDALIAAEEAGVPPCPARWPLTYVYNEHGEIVGWTDVMPLGRPGGFLECHWQFGHTGSHRHEGHGMTFEWSER